jgi:heme O synthase-like polyprenyltransferase
MLDRALADFVSLMKPRVMSLAVFTALVGMMIAPGHLDPLLGSIAIVAIAAGAGAAGVLNMWYDTMDHDQSQRQHDAAARADEYAFAALSSSCKDGHS